MRIRLSNDTINHSVLATLILVVTVLLGPSAVYGEFRAAIAVRDVTPDPLLPVSGGIGPSQATTRTMGDLNVRALVLERDQTRVAICSTDFLGFPAVLGDKVRSQVNGIPSENILIGATHTHSAPDCYGFPDQSGKTSVDLAYLDFICKQLADAVNEAIRDLQAVQLKIATGKARGKIAYNYYAEVLYDPRCHVLQALDLQGKPIATLVNYACHPEVLGSNQGILSPDFVGPLYERLQKHGGGVGIYMNGPLGGMVTADCRGPDGRDIQTWEECRRIGHQLADESLRIVRDAPLQPEPSLFCGSTVIDFPVDNQMMLTIMKLSPLNYQANQEGGVSTRVNVINIGNAQMLTIPGEAMPNIGYYLKRKMFGQHNFLFGLTNDAFGYILIKEDWNSFERYNYISQTCLGEPTGDIFIEEALGFIDTCPRPETVD